MIVGFDPRFNYMKLVRAAHHLRDDSVLFLESTVLFGYHSVNITDLGD